MKIFRFIKGKSVQIQRFFYQTIISNAVAYAGFNPLYEEGHIREAGCMAHARRKIHESACGNRRRPPPKPCIG
ncbi:transposase [Enterobacteriales bacterium SAP-6]|uniref:Transposase n=1 Tax=Acerihabitans arboris TaxID=2691583 RepID=A0A845SJG7_9GAMM|nr:transposase [Acerihabitans arboris]